MIPKNCFKSGPIGFFFLYFRCDKGLVGTRETGGSFLRSMLIQKSGGKELVKIRSKS